MFENYVWDNMYGLREKRESAQENWSNRVGSVGMVWARGENGWGTISEEDNLCNVRGMRLRRKPRRYGYTMWRVLIAKRDICGASKNASAL